MGREGLEDIRRHIESTVAASQDGWLKAWNKSRGIALDEEDRCGVRHGRLIITLLMGSGRERT